MFDNTFITLHRKITTSACFDDAELLKVWVWCLVRANHKDREIVHAGQVIKLKRGDFITGRFEAAKELKTTSMKFRSRIALLEKLGQITRKVTNKYTIISVVNYDYYQGKEKKLTNKQPTNNQQTTTDNNVNNVNNQPGETGSPPLVGNLDDMSWNKQSDDYDLGVVDIDGDLSLKEIKKKPTQKYPNAPIVRKLFQEILGVNPADWNRNTAVLQACENLLTEHNVEKVRNALNFYKEHKDKEFCPIINTPVDLDRKYVKLSQFKTKYELE